jgi:hypothetical protein
VILHKIPEIIVKSIHYVLICCEYSVGGRRSSCGEVWDDAWGTNIQILILYLIRLFPVILLTNLLLTKQTKSPSSLTKSPFDTYKAMVKRKFDDEEEFETIAVGIFVHTLFGSVIDSLNSIATRPQASSDSHHWILDSGSDGRHNGRHADGRDAGQ